MDLHIHSIYSDGHWTPEEIVEEADNKGIDTIAITDHDAIEGYFLAKTYAEKKGITVLPGIELNTDGEWGEIHILGYLFQADHPSILSHVAWRKQEREEWGRKIIQKLRKKGYSISFDNCLERAGKGVLVRTHIAEELVASGYFQHWREAYECLLQKGKPGFVERKSFSVTDAIRLIHEAGGLAFLAHPGIYSFPIAIKPLVANGLDGIEVFHSKHSESETKKWLEIACHYQLLISGGSDFHGPNSRNPYPIGSVKMDPPISLKEWERRKSAL
ncbi:PHP domain-containing protein [Aeribacillus alveayuensis]|uniref:Metal-dependent phosphoesterase TrpH n=1 Tax=Aeribacillus alveayuensis TaxID=279215 RepID=A0ABT9VRM1_9BACI|nr:putative metal-dependent phosphoesterase TrpH [Bacillus alveayuensis]